ncbi:MAG: lipoprotein [Nitratireductor sp.]|nr:lipoprotein [Nitratireductor sp.]
MSRATIRQASVMAVLLATVFGLSACGRRGALEPPPSAKVLSTDETGAAVETKVDRPFILDGLL